jgi:hypothetical protein
MPVAVLANAIAEAPSPAPDAIAPFQVGAPIPDPANAPDLIVIAQRARVSDADSTDTPVIVSPPRGSDVRVTHARRSKITFVWITDAN